MKHTKIAIIGWAWNVWATTAYSLMMKNLVSEIVLLDYNENKLDGEVRDLSDALPFCNTSIIKSWTYKDVRDSDIVIITAGSAQLPWETRIDLFKKNKEIVLWIIEKLKPINSNAIILIITNPVDVITSIVQKTSGLPRNQVFWSGTLLDSQRLRWYLSEKLHIAEQSIDAYVIWEHWDSEFAAWSYANIAGKLITDFSCVSKEDLDDIENKTRNEAYKIIECKWCTFYGIAACIADICENIVFNQKRVMPVSCFNEKYQTSFWMPAILWDKWIEKVLEIPLSKNEEEKLRKSAEKLIEIWIS